MKIITTQLKINSKQNQLKKKHNRKPIWQNTNQPKTQANATMKCLLLP